MAENAATRRFCASAERRCHRLAWPAGSRTSPQRGSAAAAVSTPLRAVAPPPSQSCTTRVSNGFPIPDPNCTPGAINPTLTIEVLRDPRFTTRCVRDAATKEEEKVTTYEWYHVARPSNNSGENQSCELDHLISLELGGAETLDNIWPQCGPSGVALPQRFFKEKDTVENFLAMQVREGRMDLTQVQKGIATDWTQFLGEARRACPVLNKITREP
jgi:hypothetical protein